MKTEPIKLKFPPGWDFPPGRRFRTPLLGFCDPFWPLPRGPGGPSRAITLRKLHMAAGQPPEVHPEPLPKGTLSDLSGSNRLLCKMHTIERIYVVLRNPTS